MPSKAILYHILAVVVVLIWGVTYVSSKVLLLHGMTPAEIFTVRFVIAYALIWFISPRKLLADSWRDEFLLFLLGLTGGSLYFVSENVALTLSYSTNVSFIVSSNPLFIVLLGLLFVREVRWSWPLIIGSLLAICGVGVIIFNGHVLKLNPLGDFLALMAALSWAVYSLLIRLIDKRYSSVFITRKVFFYGLLTMFPWFLVHPWDFSFSGFLDTAVLGNILFLSLVASLGCFFAWTVVVKKIGMVTASNYLYLNPLATVVASAVTLAEPFTALAALGAVMILGGIYLSQKR